MAKFPRPGQVKTRLAPQVAPEASSQLAQAMLRDVVRNLRRLPPHIALHVAVAPPRAVSAMRRLVGRGIAVFPQRGRDLGQRIWHALLNLRAQGFQRFVVVGADHPTLPPRYIARALRSLQRRRPMMAIGPTEDGGYYLIGLNQLAPALFLRMAWSTSSVAAETVSRARRLGISTHQLPSWFDVDTPKDVRALCRAFHRTPGALRRIAPATAAWLAQHVQNSDCHGTAESV